MSFGTLIESTQRDEADQVDSAWRRDGSSRLNLIRDEFDRIDATRPKLNQAESTRPVDMHDDPTTGDDLTQPKTTKLNQAVSTRLVTLHDAVTARYDLTQPKIESSWLKDPRDKPCAESYQRLRIPAPTLLYLK